VTDAADPPASARLRFERIGVTRARRLAAGDLAGLDPVAGWPHADTLDAVRLAAEHATTDDETGFLVLLAATGQVVGDAGWKGGPDADGSAEIGYGLAASVRGQGLGTELVRALAHWALRQPGCTTVRAEVLPGNLPSRRALERTGFTCQGEDGSYVVLTLTTAVVTGE
jgi:RimJ/RimL family protein N-acetyltransferase